MPVFSCPEKEKRPVHQNRISAVISLISSSDKDTSNCISVLLLSPAEAVLLLSYSSMSISSTPKPYS